MLINQCICPILGVRVYTPLVNDLAVVTYCLNMNRLFMLRSVKSGPAVAGTSAEDGVFRGL